jgi:hypothetical protein
MTSPTIDPADRHRRIQERIRARARAFDIPALLALLEHLGYRRTDIVFRGHHALGPQPALVHDIVFADEADHQHHRAEGDGHREDDTAHADETDHELHRAEDDGHREGGTARVIVTVNMGLLSCRSPLPSYFHELLTDLDTGDPLRELLRVVDAQLLATRCAGYRPERMLPGWQGLQQDVLHTAGLGAPSTLHALFHRVFPELDLSVRRVPGERVLRTENARLGHAVLGGCAFGSRSSAAVSAIEVILRCAEPLSRAGAPWAREARARLHTQIFALLRDTDLHLTVYLVMLDRSTYARFDGESYVGYDPLRGGPALPHRVLLFRGPVSRGAQAEAESREPAGAEGEPAGSRSEPALPAG